MSATLKLNIGMMSYIFASFCACSNLDRGLETYVSNVETQHRNVELHYCFDLLLLSMEGQSFTFAKGFPKTKFAIKSRILFHLNSTPSGTNSQL